MKQGLENGLERQFLRLLTWRLPKPLTLWQTKINFNFWLFRFKPTKSYDYLVGKTYICYYMWQKQAKMCLHNYEKLLQMHDFFQVHSIHIWRILWWAWTETQIRAQPFQKQCSNSNNNDDMFKSRLLRSCGGFYHMLWTALLYFLKENHSNRCCGANQVNHVWSKAGRSTGTACSAIPEHNPSIVHLFRSYIFICSN